jgi:hypothetical protein
MREVATEAGPYYFCRVSKCRALKFRRIDLEVKFLTFMDSLRFDETFRPLVKEVEIQLRSAGLVWRPQGDSNGPGNGLGKEWAC